MTADEQEHAKLSTIAAELYKKCKDAEAAWYRVQCRADELNKRIEQSKLRADLRAEILAEMDSKPIAAEVQPSQPWPRTGTADNAPKTTIAVGNTGNA